MRRFLIALALLLGVFFLLTSFAQLSEILIILQRGNMIFLGLALILEIAWILNLGAFYQSVYFVLGMKEKLLHVVKLVTAAYFMTVIAPSAGLSAMAVYLADAQRNGRSKARVTVAGILYVWFEYIGTLIMIVLGLAELAHRNNLHWTEITASLVLVAGAIGIGMLLYLGMQSAAALARFLTWLAGLVNAVVRPFIHRDYLKQERAVEFSQELVDGLSVLRHNPRWISRPLIFTLTNKALLVGVLACCFLAFKVPVDAGTVVIGQSISHLFLIVSPTPAGIGIVEGTLAIALGSLGVPLSDATVVTLAYRGFSFWLPFFIGMVMFRLLGGTKKPQSGQAILETTPAAPIAEED